MQYQAWLSATPEFKTGDEPNRQARYELIEARPRDRHLLELPDPGEAAYLLDYLNELGMCRPTGQGIVPITDESIEAWMRTRGVPLDPWECSALISMSRAYCGMLRKAERIDCDPPGHDEDRGSVEKQGIKEALRGAKIK